MKDPLPRKALRRLGEDLKSADAAPAPAPAGTLGKYALLREIGRGAMGVVYEGEDLLLRRRVAIKVLNAGIEMSETARRRFQREAEASAGLSHPNVITVYDAGESEGRMFLVMELVEGRPLSEHLGSRRPDPDGVLVILEKVARGVGAAHEKRIIHRDLKPGNILVTPAGEPKVGDFGLAHIEEVGGSLTRSGALVGTPMYMSPEQVGGDPDRISFASDVYALGTILYEALTGTMPHTGRTLPEIYNAIAGVDPVPPRKLNPRIPAAVELICLKALAKEPGRRYATAGELADDIHRFLSDGTVLARSSSMAYRTWTRIRRNPMPWGSALVAAGILATAAFLVARSERRALTLSEELAKKEADLSLEARAREISSAYHDLSLATLEPLRRLEDRYFGGAGTGGLEADLAVVERVAREAGARYPGTTLPRAWNGLALNLGGRAEGIAELEAAAAGADPLSQVMLARALLAEYVRDLRLPQFRFLSVRKAEVGDFVEPPALKELRERAAAAIEKALASPVGALVKHGQEFLVYARGAQYLGQRRYGAAATELSALEGHAFLRGEADLLRGTALYLEGRYGEAAEAWERAGGRGWAIPLHKAGVARMNKGILSLHDGADPRPECGKALEDMGRALQLAPALAFIRSDRAFVHFTIGSYLEDRGDPRPHYDAAIEDCDEALRALPGDPIPRLNRGVFLRKKADDLLSRGGDPFALYDAAIGDFEAALAGGPELERTALMNLGNALGRKGSAEAAAGRDPAGSFDAALAAFDRAIKANPGTAELHLGRANVLSQRALVAETRKRDGKEDLDLALAELDKALRIDPSNPAVFSAIASAWIQRGSAAALRGGDPLGAYQRAVDTYTRCLEVTPDNSPMLRNRAIALLLVAEADPERAREALERGIRDYTTLAELLPMDSTLRTQRGLARVKLARVLGMAGTSPTRVLELAIEDLSEALKRRAEDADALLGRGRAWHMLGQARRIDGGDVDEALVRATADLEKAAGLDSARIDVPVERAELLITQGRKREALKVLESVLRLRPDLRELAAEVEALRRELREQ